MNSLFRLIRENKILRKIYKVLNVAPLYHWSFAFLGSLAYPIGKEMTVIGVTGTKGKTTTLEILNVILEGSGASTAFLSSARMKIAGSAAKNMTGNSMPGRFYIHKFLHRAWKAGCKYALLEATSEGVKLHRHKFIPWRIALITNLAPEHIESHGSFEKYRDAKGAFLAYALAEGATVFLNRADEHTEFYINMLRTKRKEPDIVLFSGEDVPWVNAVKPAVDGQHAFLMQFNQENIAAAQGISRKLGISDEAIQASLVNFSGVPGRMEFVQTKPFAAVVDYAHTPDSLMKVYDSLQKSPYRGPQGKLICVLGSCGGGRDTWKRPIMGRIAAEYCDRIILTNEDPYDEDPEKIVKDIANGFESAQNRKFVSPDSYQVILDRREALAAAVRDAKPGDVVVATGKGSESWIHMAGGAKMPWNEREVLQQTVAGSKT